MATPTIEWDESNPSGVQAKSLGAVRIREMKTQFREIFSVDHIMSSSGSGATWGYHKKCTFYNRSLASIPPASTGCLYAMNSNSKSALFWIDENDNEVQLTNSLGFIGGMTGEVRIFSGLIANIPPGWALCDGVSNPLNLIGKFIRGINTSVTEPGTPGGADSISLSTMPAHTHTASCGSTSAPHAHSITYYTNEYYNKGAGATTKYFSTYHPSTYGATDQGTSSHNDHSGTSGSSGSGTGFDNRPAYLENVFIIKE